MGRLGGLGVLVGPDTGTLLYLNGSLLCLVSTFLCLAGTLLCLACIFLCLAQAIGILFL